jgi:dipeptidyl aminopeptidase/acylaminoacyl peptidase
MFKCLKGRAAMALRGLLWTALGLAGVLAQGVHAQTAAPPAAELFFQRPAMSGAQLSPDGRKVALRAATKDRRPWLLVLNLETMQTKVVASFADEGIDRFQWVNNQRLVFALETELVGPGYIEAGPGLYAVNADGSGFRQLVDGTSETERPTDSGVPVLSWHHSLHHDAGPGTGDEVLVVSAGEVSKEKIDYLNLKRLNTVTGRYREIEAPVHAVDWTFDQRAQLRMVVTEQANHRKVLWREPAGTWKTLSDFDALDGDGWEPLFLAPDDTLYVSQGHGDKTAIYKLDLATGQVQDKPFIASKDFDLHPEFLVRNDKLIGVRYTVDAEVTQWLDDDAKVVQAVIDKSMPATANRLSFPLRGDSPFVLVQATSDAQPTITLVFNTATRKLTRLGTSQPGIDAKRMGTTDFVHYPARDGRSIPAYITLPPGGAKTNLPMVVLVHGGPFVRGAQWRWNAEVQFLASRGYAVLQPEFRGSTGYGHQHFKAGWKQWGQAMQTDLADAARWAIAQGLADPKRIALAGASYGGYATLMGLAQEPGLFKVGINWVGVTDLNLMYDTHWSDATNEWKKYGMPRLVGDQKADAAMLKANSPLENAARIQQPLLMAYGKWDVRVPIVHGEKFRDAIRPHNPQVEWVVYPEEGHGWHKLETNIDFWGRVERFLARHLAAD